MPEVPNITDHLAKLREKDTTTVFREAAPPSARTVASQRPPSRFRSSPTSWLAIGITGGLFVFQLFAAALFSLLD